MYVLSSGRRGWRGGEWMRGLGLSFTNSVGIWSVGRVSVFWLRGWGVGRWHKSRLVRVVLSDMDSSRHHPLL